MNKVLVSNSCDSLPLHLSPPKSHLLWCFSNDLTLPCPEHRHGHWQMIKLIVFINTATNLFSDITIMMVKWYLFIFYGVTWLMPAILCPCRCWGGKGAWQSWEREMLRLGRARCVWMEHWWLEKLNSDQISPTIMWQ